VVGLRLVKTTWNGMLMGPAPWSSRPPGLSAGFPKSLFSPVFGWGLVRLLPLVDSQLSSVKSFNCTQEWGQRFYLQIKQALGRTSSQGRDEEWVL
uniref:Uncharacterized protein n=1 Tax=Pan paniscus TaxID=9597 RepID=A0A2R8ZP33_PANPA